MNDLGERPQQPVAQTCPDCGGALREEALGTLTQFRCHIGHVMTAQVLVSAQLEILERDLSSVLRMLNERAGLCRELATKHASSGNTQAEALWMRAADEPASSPISLRPLAV